MKRKTVEIQRITDLANQMLATTPDVMKDNRRGIISFVDSLLIQVGRYEGFGYINGWPCEDETRVFFY